MIRILFSLIILLFCANVQSQTFIMNDGDTINLTLGNGKKQGFWRYFWPNGDLKYEVYYEQGEKEGLEISYYDGQDCIEYSNTYNKGMLDGPRVMFYPNCSARVEEMYKNGLKDGYERNFDQTGVLLTEGNFSKGELDGSYAHFDKKGYVTYESPSKETTLKFDKFLSGEYKIKDSTLFFVFKRNKEWKKMMLVVDMTGSMFPYIGQMLVWYRQNYEDGRVKYYALFNDGDNLTDDKKVLGKTGGVHPFEAKDYRKLKKDIEDVRKLGEGGDDPENDVEALTAAMVAFRDYSDIILIADESNVRDMALLKRIKKPIHVIMCGTKKGINEQYLRIAYQTKGSFHTISNDIDMKKLKDGEEFQVDNDIFRLSGGNFIWVEAVE
jgi:antitoxin component YwqK of YwqJK toxin-antitoxin module